VPEHVVERNGLRRALLRSGLRLAVHEQQADKAINSENFKP